MSGKTSSPSAEGTANGLPAIFVVAALCLLTMAALVIAGWEFDELLRAIYRFQFPTQMGTSTFRGTIVAVALLVGGVMLAQRDLSSGDRRHRAALPAQFAILGVSGSAAGFVLWATYPSHWLAGDALTVGAVDPGSSALRFFVVLFSGVWLCALVDTCIQEVIQRRQQATAPDVH